MSGSWETLTLRKKDTNEEQKPREVPCPRHTLGTGRPSPGTRTGGPRVVASHGPTALPAYLFSRATGSVRSSPGKESMAAPPAGPGGGQSGSSFVRGFGGSAGIQTPATVSAIFAPTDVKLLKPRGGT